MEHKDLEQLKEKARSGAVWSLLQQMTTRGMSLVFYVMLARLLSAEDFGLMAAAAVFLAVSDLLMEQGFGKSLIQHAELRPDHVDTAFWMQMSVAIVVSGTGILIAPWLADLYGRPELVPIIRCLLLVTPLSALNSMQDALLQRELKYRQLARRQLVATLCSGVVGVAVAASGGGIWSLVVQQITYSATSVVLLWSASTWRPGRQIRRAALRDIAGFSVHLFFLRGVYVLKSRTDHFLIALFLAPASLGAYVAASKVVDTVTDLCLTPFTGLGLALFSRLQNHGDALRRAYLKSVYIAALIGFPVSAGLAVLARDIVLAGFGAKWIAATALLQVLALTVFNRAIGQANASLLLATRQSLARLLVSAGYFVVSTVLMLVFIRRGVIAAAWINVACNFAILPITFALATRVLKVSRAEYLRLLVPPLAASVLMALAVIPLRQQLAQRLDPWAVFVVVTALGSIAYGGILWIVSARFRALAHEGWAWGGERWLRFRK